ncbi:hypothetical protein C7212DRAFT_345053 [Tuber magnatum]|uniref:Uncharacterized protein n=1 Tax=Tuber magnatum TaxID=42249 RepID=A0A317SWM8_9PEZI|nr:hypothetical protein C7212DRAFT_345053 [Tuber magnatum]
MVTVTGLVFLLDNKIDGSIKDHSIFKVDIIKSIAELGDELRKLINDGNAAVHKEFAKLKSDQKLMEWQLHFLFFGGSSVRLVLWSLKDYIQLRFPTFFTSEKGTPPLRATRGHSEEAAEVT